MASHTHDGEFGFQIAPMLDVLFVLLLFFMVTAGVQKREASLRADLPGTSQRSPSDLVLVDVDIGADGQVLFNGSPVDAGGNPKLPEMITRLRAVLAEAPDRLVVIRPDPGARQQRVVAVLDACKAAQAKKVAFSPAAE
jgi:biopolymer transport protein ExbD